MASGQTGVISKSAGVGVGVSRSKAISNLSLGKDQLEKVQKNRKRSPKSAQEA